MRSTASTALLCFSLAASTQAVTLFEGLAAANASKFSNFIQSNPTLVAIFISPAIKTVFAPHDDVFDTLNHTDLRRSLHLFSRQDTDQGALQDCSETESKLSELPPNGGVVPSKLPTDGGAQSPIIAKPQPPPPPAQNSTTKRQVAKNKIYLFTGLGRNVTVIKADTPYDGGLIHTIDGFVFFLYPPSTSAIANSNIAYRSFTVPQSFSNTLGSKGLTGFTSALNSTNSTNITSTISAPVREGVTILVPSNEAFDAVSGNLSDVNLADHIIPNFLGVTPNLKDGLILTTQAGTQIKVTVKGGEIFFNRAKIIGNDVITSNGAVQVIDKVRGFFVFLSRFYQEGKLLT